MRQSAFRGTWSPNRRPYINFAPDAYVAFQGETSVIACGECRREVNFNDYVTGISTEASVDAPPGSATINLSIPDNDANDFFMDGELIIVEMMEVEIYAKGYYLIGGTPQYYRIFWGLVSTVTKNWSNGVTTVTIACKDMLRWWELTTTTVNPAFLESFGSSAGGYQLFQNQFAGQNAYATIIQLAQDAMGDFLLTTGSFTSYRPEKGPESGVIGSYSKDVMSYWQLKFANIQSNLVVYGTSGQAYSFSAVRGTVSPNQIANTILQQEYDKLQRNQRASTLFTNATDIVTAKIEVARAGDVEFFQADNQTKLSIALHARDQLQYEFYCDTTGDIIFKPPFYNLNVLPNKPVSWIQDIDVIDDSVVNSEAEVVTHVTSSGNAFGGPTDWGLNDEITTPRTGVYDFHLLRRYGWRRADLQVEWAGNPRKLFFHLLDWMDRLNSKRRSGTVTIPMRPELRMGFPIWFPKYDSFFYIQGISHQYSPGGQATTTLTLTARRSKFIAPKGIGEIRQTGRTTSAKKGAKGDVTYEVAFPGVVGSSSGLSQNNASGGEPAVIRDPKTGKLLGYPNVVMVYRTTYDGTVLAKILESKGSATSKNTGKKAASEGVKFNYNVVRDLYKMFTQGSKDELISRIRAHRYEAGMTNTGAYDYAHDVNRVFKELALIPADRISWGVGTDGGPNNNRTFNPDGKIVVSQFEKDSTATSVAEQIKTQQSVVADATKQLRASEQTLKKAKKTLITAQKGSGDPDGALAAAVRTAESDLAAKATVVDEAKSLLRGLQTVQKGVNGFNSVPSLNILVRPVSDEFGFEVIGHYRYGRGVFIDRGQMKVQDTSTQQIVNQLSIQFSPTAGIITDASVGSNIDPTAADFASQFERMQPDDYVTGASFAGVMGGQVTDVQTTSSATYTNVVNANRGTSLYIEADATRRAKTLAELRPTIEMGGFSQAFNSGCACGLGKASWYTLLPQELIAKVVGSSNMATGTAEMAGTAGGYNDSEPKPLSGHVNVFDQVQRRDVPLEEQTYIAGGGATGSEFFSALSTYLSDLLQQRYDQYNSVREDAYTAASRYVVNPNDVPGAEEQTNVLGDPGNSLFSRAAAGDPAALEALQGEANFSFGQSPDALKHFAGTTNDAEARAKKSLSDLQSGFGRMSWAPVSVSSGAPQQQYQPPTPTIGNGIINPTSLNTAANNLGQ